MKRVLALLIAVAASLSAGAQTNVCTGLSASGPATLEVMPDTWAALPCLPDVLGGTGKGYGTRASASGVVAWLWCPDGAGWGLRWFAAPVDRIGRLAGGLPAALASSDRSTALLQLGDDAAGDLDLATAEMKALWCPHWSAMMAGRPATVRWVVAPALSTANPPGTRPTYRYVAPAAIAVDGLRIAQGEPCNCALTRYASGSTVYCSVAGVAARVAVCKVAQ